MDIQKDDKIRKITVLYIITVFQLGGAQKHVHYHLKYLDRSRFEPVLAAGQEGWLLEEARWMGVPTYQIDNLGRPIRPLKDIRALFELYRLIKHIKPDIIHCHSSKAGILGRMAARAAGVRGIVFTAHGWAFTEGLPSMKQFVYRHLENLISRITSKIILVSDYDYDLSERLGVARREKKTVVKNGIDFSYKGEDGIDELRERLGFERDKLIVTMVSRLANQKDPLAFVKLAALNKGNGAFFVLVGDGPMCAQVERAVKVWGLTNFRLLGDRHDIEDILKASDVFCFFSNWEALPLAVIEAMAAGLPVIANPVGGVPELVLDGINGYLVDKSDVEHVNTRLRLLLTNTSLIGRMGSASREIYLSSFRAPVMVKQTENIYERMFY